MMGKCHSMDIRTVGKMYLEKGENEASLNWNYKDQECEIHQPQLRVFTRHILKVELQ